MSETNDKILDCPHCENQGWFADANQYDGEMEQVQCQFCYTEPRSVFSVVTALEKANKQLEEKVIALRPNAERVKELEASTMPRELTAENGAKYALSYEFQTDHREICPVCLDQLTGDEDCKECLGDGYINTKVYVSWPTIKDIYKAAAELFPPQEPSDDWVSVEDRLPTKEKHYLLKRTDQDSARVILYLFGSGFGLDEFELKNAIWCEIPKQNKPAPPVENKDER